MKCRRALKVFRLVPQIDGERAQRVMSADLPSLHPTDRVVVRLECARCGYWASIRTTARDVDEAKSRLQYSGSTDCDANVAAGVMES